MYRMDYYVAYSLICGLLLAGLVFVLHQTAKAVFGNPRAEGAGQSKTVARLLAVGLYSVCLGYVAITLGANLDFNSAIIVADDLAVKAGFFFVLLGFLQVLNILVLAVYRKRRDAGTPPAVL